MKEPFENEEWRSFSCSDDYEISNYGRVKSLSRTIIRSDGNIQKIKERILRQGIGTTGYHYVICCIDGKHKTVYIHQELMLAFVGKPNGFDVDHINSVKTDNRLCNLRYLTHFENSSRANKGKHKDNSMEKNPRTKSVVGYLNGKVVESFDCAKKISLKYGINYSTLRSRLQNNSLIINGVNYFYEN